MRDHNVVSSAVTSLVYKDFGFASNVLPASTVFGEDPPRPPLFPVGGLRRTSPLCSLTLSVLGLRARSVLACLLCPGITCPTSGSPAPRPQVSPLRSVFSPLSPSSGSALDTWLTWLLDQCHLCHAHFWSSRCQSLGPEVLGFQLVLCNAFQFSEITLFHGFLPHFLEHTHSCFTFLI